MSDDKSKLNDRAKNVQKFWFQNLPEEKREAIIRPAFDAAHPTNDKIREAADKYKEATGK